MPQGGDRCAHRRPAFFHKYGLCPQIEIVRLYGPMVEFQIVLQRNDSAHIAFEGARTNPLDLEPDS